MCEMMRTVFLLCLDQYSIVKTILVHEGEVRAYTVADGTVHQCCRHHPQSHGCFVARELNHYHGKEEPNEARK